jgi:hypothetical protein
VLLETCKDADLIYDADTTRPNAHTYSRMQTEIFSAFGHREIDVGVLKIVCESEVRDTASCDAHSEGARSGY